MPIYEYRCDNCGHELEAFQKLSENPLKTCPECNQDALIKKVSAAGFRLKGSGWYETDFKKSGDKKKNVGSTDDKGGSSSSSDKASTTDSSSSDKKASSSSKSESA